MRVVGRVKGLICDNRIGIDGKSGLLVGDICYLLSAMIYYIEDCPERGGVSLDTIYS